MTVKIPEPMTAPMPSEVSESGPRVFRSLFSGSSDSAMSLSIDLQQNAWFGRIGLLLHLMNGVYRGTGRRGNSRFGETVFGFSAPSFQTEKDGAVALALALSAAEFLDFLFVGAARSGAGCPWSGLFACCALYLFAFCLVGD